MNVFVSFYYLFLCLIYLPLPILGVCLIRSKCEEKKILLQLLLLAALEYIGHPAGLLEKIFDQALSEMSNGILVTDTVLIVYRVIIILIVSFLLWKKMNQKAVAVVILPILFLPGLIWNVWTTCAIAVVVYGFCIRGLLKKRPEPEKARSLLVVACICVILTGVGECGIGVQYNREKAFMYHILADTFSDTDPDMEISYFEAAVKYDPQPNYMKDYAVALIKTGYFDRGEKVLDKAMKKGLSDDYIHMIQGWLSYKRQNNKEETIKHMQYVVEYTDDDTMRNEAILILVEIYKEDWEWENAIEVLENAESKYGDSMSDETLEQFAIFYYEYVNTDMSDDPIRYLEKALELYESLYDRGYSTELMMEQISQILIRLDRLPEAQEMIQQLINYNIDNFKAYELLGDMEQKRQEELPEEERNYIYAIEAYQKAKELYLNGNVVYIGHEEYLDETIQRLESY